MGTSVTAGNTAQKPGTAAEGNRNIAVRSFVRSSLEHVEPVAYDVSQQMSTTAIKLPDIEIPASGYFRALRISVSTTGGAGTGVGVKENGPFNAITDIVFQEPNGAQLYALADGYQSHVARKYGGFFGKVQDTRQLATYSVSSIAANTTANFSFTLRIPAEIIKRDALGALPNQNAAAKYRVKMNLNTVANVFSGTVSTAPTVRIRATLEGWEQPLEVLDGVPQATKPPLVNSTMYHTFQDYAIAAGSQQTQLTRLGNRIRALYLIFTDASGSRSANDANLPDPLTISLDNRPILQITRYQWLDAIAEYFGYVNSFGNTVAAAGTALAADSGGARENGVWPLLFNTEFMAAAGQEFGDLWLKTLTTSRLELSGTWGAAGKLTVITNDIALTGEL